MITIRRSVEGAQSVRRAMTFQLGKEGSFIVLKRDALALFSRYRQVNVDDTEAGGLLLGVRKEGGHLEIESATEPTHCDGRRRYWFGRELNGHKEAADDIWKTSKGKRHYVGEWHSHPEDDPSPSWMDRAEWMKLAFTVKPLPLVMVIVGREGLWVGAVNRTYVRKCRLLK